MQENEGNKEEVQSDPTDPKTGEVSTSLESKRVQSDITDPETGEVIGGVPAPLQEIKPTRINDILSSLKNTNLVESEKRIGSTGFDFQKAYTLPKEIDGEGLKYGIEETLDVLAVILILVKAFLEGGFSNYLAVMLAFPKAISGMSLIPFEIDDLDKQELQTLIDYVINNYPDTPTEKATQIVKHSIKSVYHIFMVVKTISGSDK